MHPLFYLSISFGKHDTNSYSYSLHLSSAFTGVLFVSKSTGGMNNLLPKKGRYVLIKEDTPKATEEGRQEEDTPTQPEPANEGNTCV